MTYQNRSDVLEFLDQFEHKEMYLFIRNKLDNVLNEGDYKDGLDDDAIFDEVAKEASQKYSLSLEGVYKEFDSIEFKVSDFMNKSK